MSAAASIKKTVFILCLFMLLMLGLLVNKQLSQPMFNKEQLREHGVYMYDKPRLIKNFMLQDHHGKEFSKEQLKGKWTLVFFGFTYCPDVCPTTMATLKNMIAGIEDKNIADSTRVLLVSVDPARDTPAQLAQYVPYFDPSFIGITGEFMTIYGFASNLSAPFQKVADGGENYTVDHSANLFLINPQGDYQGFFKPPFSAEGLRAYYLSVRQIYNE